MQFLLRHGLQLVRAGEDPFTQARKRADFFPRLRHRLRHARDGARGAQQAEAGRVMLKLARAYELRVEAEDSERPFHVVSTSPQPARIVARFRDEDTANEWLRKLNAT